MVEGILFVIGLIGLWLGTEWVVKSAIGIAKRFNLSHAFVGLAIVAVGTDLPEVFVSVKASMLQLAGVESSGIITGNAIGSSISQISIILGIAGLFLHFTLSQKELFRDGLALIASIGLLFLVGFDGYISRIDGLLLLAAYVFYYWILLQSKHHSPSEREFIPLQNGLKLTLYLTAGIALLILCSHLVVENAMFFAKKWNVAQSFVGIVLIGLGTSLPELAVSIGAAIRKSAGLSVGNIMGSNIFDTLVPIGTGGVISQVSMENGLLRYDLPIQLGITLLVVIFLKSSRGISKIESVALIACYLVYVFLKL